MNPFSSSSRGPSSEFERISLDDLSARREPPQLQIVPPAEGDVPQPSTLSPSRPIIIPRVSLRRKNTSTSTTHWRRPSYSRVDSSANPPTEPRDPAPPYDEEGVEPDIQEVQEGLNAALGTDTRLGSWLPTTRRPSFRKVEQTEAPPQIVIEDTTVEETFVPDERETAGLTLNASQIAGVPAMGRSLQRPQITDRDMLGPDIRAMERRGSATEQSLTPGLSASDSDKGLLPGTNSVIRHLRKTSQRIVNIANAEAHAEGGTELPFSMAKPRAGASTQESPQEFPFPSVGPQYSPAEKLYTEFSASETGHSSFIDTVEFRGKSLGIFGPHSAIRNLFCEILLHGYVVLFWKVLMI